MPGARSPGGLSGGERPAAIAPVGIGLLSGFPVRWRTFDIALGN